MSENKKLDLFYFRMYAFGLLFTFLIAILKFVAIKFNIESLLKAFNNWLPYVLLIVPSLLISRMYWYAKRELKKSNDVENLKIFYKEYIQLEGYIQTLIGFFIAILGLIPITKKMLNSKEIMGSVVVDPDFGLIALPIGMALVTSILGWYFGSDIAPPKKQSDVLNNSLDNLDTATKLLSHRISDLSNEIHKTKTKYEKTTNQFVENSTKLYENQEGIINNYNLSLSTLKETNKNYTTEVKQTLNNIKDNLHTFQHSYQTSITTFQDNILKIQRKNQEKIIQSVENYFSGLNEQVSNGFVDINEINTSFENYLKKIKKDFGNSNLEIEKFIKTLKTHNENVIKNSEVSNEALNNINNKLKEINSTILIDLRKNKTPKEHKKVEKHVEEKKTNITESLISKKHKKSWLSLPSFYSRKNKL